MARQVLPSGKLPAHSGLDAPRLMRRSFDQLWLCIVQQSGEGLSLVFLCIVGPSCSSFGSRARTSRRRRGREDVPTTDNS